MMMRLALLELLLLCACGTAPPQRVDLPQPLPTASSQVKVEEEPRKATITVPLAQPGAHLFIDGVDAGPLPLSMPIAPGRHVVRVEGARYEPRERTVTLAPGETFEVRDKLVVVRGKATLVLLTPGATVELVSGSDRRVVPQLPLSIDFARDKEWTIEASKPGHRTYVQPIRFEDGVAEKTYEIRLEP